MTASDEVDRHDAERDRQRPVSEASGTSAAPMPRSVNGSRTAVDDVDREERRPTAAPGCGGARRSGSAATRRLCRRTASSPRQATAVKRISETMPAPRVANHRIWVAHGSALRSVGRLAVGIGVHLSLAGAFRLGYAVAAIAGRGAGSGPASRRGGRPRRRVDDEPGRQAGSLRARRRAAPPRTIAAVAAVFASTHVAATTDAVRHGDSTGSPVRGSIR